jgi:hypothetical protein
MRILTLAFILLTSLVVFAQQDTTWYPWPLAPMGEQKNITGTFGEYRSTSAAGHFHNGTDIPGAAGTPVLAVLPGVVATAFHDGSTGYDSYVRITSNINGQSKNITYYHTIPNVSVGQNVAVGQQIATVAIDHVHLIEYKLAASVNTNNSINSIRPMGGLYYGDPWKPFIRYVKFILDGTEREVPANSLGSKIDIIAHIEEINGTSASAKNNGAYRVGYKILSADMQTVVYNPPDNGLRFEFYNHPLNTHVGNTFYKKESSTSKHVYILTNGAGAASVASTQLVTNSFWNVDQFPYGDYMVMVFAQDSRGNADTVYIPVTTTNVDLIPPAAPVMKYVKSDAPGKVKLEWIAPPDADLKGYRMYYSENGINYVLRSDENVLTASATSVIYDVLTSNAAYFRLFAVDTATTANISIQSDTYGIRVNNNPEKILIVDGFDRFGGSGSWQNPYHDFVRYYGETFNLPFESCANEEIINGSIALSDYQAVIWISGDESTVDEVFNAEERIKIADYLRGGGKLFASGSEIAWDLEGSSSSTPSETTFLRNYLKAKFVADNSNVKSVTGVSPFPPLSFSYGNTSSGSPYNEDFPDVIDTANGSIYILKYASSAISAAAGIAYTGPFENSVNTGQVVYFGFPFETIQGKEARTQVMNGVLSYFGFVPVSVGDDIKIINSYFLFQNYPNPFNPETRIIYHVAETGDIKIRIFDLLGKEVKLLVNEEKTPGEYSVSFNAEGLASGVYICRMEAGSFSSSKKLILLK